MLLQWIKATVAHVWLIASGFILGVIGLIQLATGLTFPVLAPVVLVIVGLVLWLAASFLAYRDVAIQAEARPDSAPEFRRALDVVVTWVYRRKEWNGLSPGGRFTEGAPDFYGQPVYDLLELDARYRTAKTSVAEPGFDGRPVPVSDIARHVITPPAPPPTPNPVLTVSAYPSPHPLVLAGTKEAAEFVHLRIDNDPELSPVDAADVFVRLVVRRGDEEIRVTARPRSLPHYNANEDRVGIRRGDHEDFDVACRFVGDPTAYIVNSESFLMDAARKHAWQLPRGTYDVDVTVFHAHGTVRQSLRLINRNGSALELQSALDVEAIKSGAEPLRTRWSTVSTDLSTLLLTPDDLEKFYVVAVHQARERLADDADASLRYLLAKGHDRRAGFYAWSERAQAGAEVVVREAGTVSVDQTDARRPLDGPIWRGDDSWLELLRQAGPLSADRWNVNVHPVPDRHPGWTPWQVQMADRPMPAPPARDPVYYGLHNGAIEECPENVRELSW